MKKISLGIGICLALVYITGPLYLPYRAQAVLYSFDVEFMQQRLKLADALDLAWEKCRKTSPEKMDACYDNVLAAQGATR